MGECLGQAAVRVVWHLPGGAVGRAAEPASGYPGAWPASRLAPGLPPGVLVCGHRSHRLPGGCGAEPGLAGSSFAAVQQWLHDFGRLDAIDPDRRDLLVGRRREGNEEIEDAPESAHVKRTAQESFDPAAFVVRRSMPWADAQGAGLLFVAFGRSPMTRRMCAKRFAWC